MEKTINVVYTISKGDSWRKKDSINIKSNIADDELVDCGISKSLIEALVKESVILEPDKLLLKFAEAQKREIEYNLRALDDMELKAQTQAQVVNDAINKAYEDCEKKYEELQKKFKNTTSKFKDEVASATDTLNNFHKKLTSVDSYSLERVTNAVTAVIKLIETDKDLMKIVLEHKNDQPT